MKVSAISWIPAEKIVEAARLYAASKPAAVQRGVALDQNRERVPTWHAMTALMAITGNPDVPGGNMIRGRLYDLEHFFE